MKVALFGGTFDPFHVGHIDPVLDVVEAVGLDRIVYLPTARPPHKNDREPAPALLRYAMVEAALAPWEHLQVSTFELRADRECFTLDTVEHFQKTRPEWDLSLLLGADAWADIETYRDWERILERLPLVVMQRPGPVDVDGHREGPVARRWLDSGRVRFVAGREVEASSSELRRLLAAGIDPPAHWLPAPVLELIRKYHLYR